MSSFRCKWAHSKVIPRFVTLLDYAIKTVGWWLLVIAICSGDNTCKCHSQFAKFILFDVGCKGMDSFILLACFTFSVTLFYKQNMLYLLSLHYQGNIISNSSLRKFLQDKTWYLCTV